MDVVLPFSFGSAPRPRRVRAVGLVVVALLAGSAFAAAAATLTGRVVAREDGRAIEGALVRVRETGAARVTDAAGRFTFADLPAGTWSVSVRHVAWTAVERAVALTADGADSLVLRVRPAVHPAEEVLVTGTRSWAPLQASPGASDVWDGADFARGAPPTLADALTAVPGVALTRDGAWATLVSIRGLGRANVVTLIDHTRLETASDIAGGLSLVDPGEIERAEVMKSPGSVLFGSGAFGGALNVVTRAPRFRETPGWAAELSASGGTADRRFAQHAAFEQSAGRWALRLAGGRRAADDARTPRGPVANSYWGDWSGHTALSVRTHGAQTLRLSWQRTQAEDTGIPGGKPIAATATARYTLARRDRWAAEYVAPRPWRAVPLLVVRVAEQDVRRNVEIRQSPTVLVTPHALHATSSAQVEARLEPGRRQALALGVEAWRRRLDSRRERRQLAQGRVTGERPVPLASFASAGVWAQHEWDAWPARARFVTGARWDRGRTRNDAAWNPEWVTVNGVPQVPVPGQRLLWPAATTHDDSWSASAGAHVRLGGPWSASAQLATAYRSPSLEERFQFLDLGSSVRLGNPALAPERSTALDLGLRAAFARVHVRADLFGNRLGDLVADTAGTWEGRPAWFKANIGRARLYGFEVAADADAGPRVVVTAAVAYVRGEDTGRHSNLSQVPPLHATLGAAFDAGRAGTWRAGLAAAHAQGNPGPDETRTAGWTTWNAGWASPAWRAAGAAWRLDAGLDNALDRAYRLHLATLRGVVNLEPGRDAHAALTASFGGDAP